MANAELFEGRREGGALGVSESVVGHDPLNPNAMLSKESDSCSQEAATAVASLVRQDLDEGQPSVVVDRHVNKVLSIASLARWCRWPTEDSVTTTWPDSGQRLDVDVDQLPGVLTDIADGQARGAVEVSQSRGAVTTQNSVDRRAAQAQLHSQPVWSLSSLLSSCQNRRRNRLTQGMRAAVGPAASVKQTTHTLEAEPAQPFVGCRPRHTHHRRDLGRGITQPLDPLHQELTTKGCQPSPSMCHESLLIGVSCITHIRTRRLLVCQQPSEELQLEASRRSS